MSMKQVTVLATIKAKKGLEETVRNEVLALVAPTRAEAGCLNYDLHQSSDDPATLMLYENWVSKEDLDKHLAMPYLQAFLGKVPELLAEPVQLLLWDKIA
jgi:quinol monooxygenase YgiN